MKKGNLKQSLCELLFHATVAFKIKYVQKEKKKKVEIWFSVLTTVVLEQSASKCCIKIKRELLDTSLVKTNLVAHTTEGKRVRNDTNCPG